MQAEAGAPLSAGSPSDTTHDPQEPEDPHTPRAGRRRPLFVTLVTVAVLILAADQATKAWALATLEPGQPEELVGTLLQLHLTFNPGAAFSLATGATWLLTLVACGVVGFTIWSARRLGSRGWALALGLLLGGALGNLTDRMLREPGPGRGHVVDFLRLPNWPIFNVADMAIVSASVLIAVLALAGIGLDGVRVKSYTGKHAAGRAEEDKDAGKESAGDA